MQFLVLGYHADGDTAIVLHQNDSLEDAKDWCNENGGAKWAEEFSSYDHILVCELKLVDGGTPTI